MLDALDPFLPVDRSDQTWSRQQQRVEAEAQILREQLLEEVLASDRDLEDFLDCLSSQGINPDLWLDAAVANMNHVMDQGVRFVANESGILLPEG